MNIEQNYNHQGYVYLEQFFSEEELQPLEKILHTFHRAWLKDNDADYKAGAINSHSITSAQQITRQERLDLFKFISQEKISQLIHTLFPGKAIFLNTQLFFDPLNGKQSNYWHRDIQYTGMTIEEQKKNMITQNVLHFRIPLKAESGIELIPGTHREWDQEVEQETRLSINNRKPGDDLERGKKISLNRGDLLVFSANMIHRGLYGNDRFTFDIIFCDDTPEFRDFIDFKNHPAKEELPLLNTDLF
nr:phytanoyl-CoA dioxygenase family protein [Chryseobacterium vaccae]